MAVAQRADFDAVVNAAPYSTAITVTPSDTVTLAQASKLIFVGSAGNLNVRMLGGTSNVFICPAGAQLPIRCDLILSTSTTASGIISLS